MKPKKPDPSTIKTTIRIRYVLHLAARKRALDEGIDFQEIVARGLALYLKHGSRT